MSGINATRTTGFGSQRFTENGIRIGAPASRRAFGGALTGVKPSLALTVLGPLAALAALAQAPPGQSVSFGAAEKQVEQRQPSNCPIEIRRLNPHSISEPGGGDPWGSYLMIQFSNVSPKTIVAVRFDVSFVDALGDKHESVYSYDSDSTVKPGKTSRSAWGDGVYAGSLGHKVGAIVWVQKLRFADDTFFRDDGSHSCGAHTK